MVKYSDTKLKQLEQQLVTAQTAIEALDGKLAAIARKDEVSQADLVQRENLRRQKKKLAGQAEQLEAAISAEQQRVEAEQRKASEAYLRDLGAQVARLRKAIVERAAELENELAESLAEHRQLVADEARAHLDLHSTQLSGRTWFAEPRVRATALECVALQLVFERNDADRRRERAAQDEREAAARRAAAEALPDPLRKLGPAPGDSKRKLERKDTERRQLLDARSNAVFIEDQRKERLAEVDAADEDDVDEAEAP